MYARQNHRRHAQQGIILFVVLALLLVLSLLGITLARTQTVEERLAQNDDNHQVALQAAEAALRAASDAVFAGSYSNGATNIQFSPTIFSLNSNGLYDISNEPTMLAATPESIANVMNWSNPVPATAVLTYNGPALSSLPPAAQFPVFLIEKMTGMAVPPSACGQSQSAAVYRITAHGFGGDGTASATLQQITYHC
jgi:type IV pilus assembly protein PilX